MDAFFVKYKTIVRNKDVPPISIPMVDGRLYQVVEDDVRVTNPLIVEIVDRVQDLEISPYEAKKVLEEYLLGNETRTYLSTIEPGGERILGENRDLLEAIKTYFDNSVLGKIDYNVPLIRVRGAGRRTKRSWNSKTLDQVEKALEKMGFGSAIKGQDRHLFEPQ